MSAQMHRFERTGLLAVDPRAFFELFFAPASRANILVDGVAVVDISGPLVQRDELWCDSYEAIRARFSEACEGEARAIMLRIDSPGGDASGCFETARALAAEAAAAQKPLLAYVDRACSAAYAIASAADVIGIGESCCAGSIGVLSTRPDYTAANMMRGLRMAFVTSGQRKLDGNPDVPLSEAELVETQRHVDELAARFFALIADQRPQLTADTLAGFDGGVFYGASAVDVGLADAVTTFDELLAVASAGGDMALLKKQPSASTLTAKSDYDSARQALEKVAKGKDANAVAARKALAALGEAEGGDDDEEKPKPEPEPEPDSEESDDDEPAAEEPDDDEPAAAGLPAAPAAGGAAPAPAATDEPKPASQAAAASSESASMLALAAKVQRLEASAAAAREARTRRKLFASRPDFSPEVVAVLKNAPLATLKEAVEKLPRGKVAASAGAPAPKQRVVTPTPTRGDGQGDSAGRTRFSGADADVLDRAMGFTGAKLGSRREGSTMYFGFVAGDEPPTNNGAA